MKTFPPLHPLVSRGLPKPAAGDIEEFAPFVRARFNAEVDPVLGQLLLDLWDAADSLAEDDLSVFTDAFGRCAAAAAIVGDTSFFEQVNHCIRFGSKDTESRAIHQNMTARAAYSMARLVSGKSNMEQLPHASGVAKQIDILEGKTIGTTEPSAVVDLCNRKAVNLPLAEGKRGPRKK